VARAIVASTWRDPVVVGPLRAEQAIDVGIAVGSLLLAAILVARSALRPSGDDLPGSTA